MPSFITKLFSDLKRDASLTSTIAGFVVVLVGMTSSAALVFQAANAAGASTEEAASWLGSLCLGMGILSIILSIYYRAPILTAWSTPGSALLVVGLKDIPISQTIGAFFFSALLIFLCGITGYFEKIMNRIPMALASALLAGVLLHFSLDAFVAAKTQPVLILTMFLSYIIARKFLPRYTMMFVLIAGTLLTTATGAFHFDQVRFSLTKLHFVAPTFSWPVLLSIGFPLFIVTMASQNLAGIAVMRTNHFNTPVSPLLTWTGLLNFLTAPFGGFAINLAAITAAIAMGPEAHPEKGKRYFSAVVAGFLYFLIGLSAATVTSLFAAFPSEMVIAVAGFALLGTIANALHRALDDENRKEAAFITFAIAASGLSFMGIGSAFWAIVAGSLAQLLFRKSTLTRKKVPG